MLKSVGYMNIFCSFAGVMIRCNFILPIFSSSGKENTVDFRSDRGSPTHGIYRSLKIFFQPVIVMIILSRVK